MAVQVVCCHQI